jgi:ABC-type uncharacterized transport system auxiliary subunit
VTSRESGRRKSCAPRSLVGCISMISLVSAACVGGRPIHYYTINRPAVTAVAAKADGLVLLVGRIAAPETLEDDRISYRAGSNEVGAYEYHRWMERPAAMVRDCLIQALRASGKYREVQEAASDARGDYLIRGKLYAFSEVDQPGIQTRVSLQLEAVDSKTGLVAWDNRYNRDEPVNGKAMKDVVASLDHNLQQVIAEAASGIETALSDRK